MDSRDKIKAITQALKSGEITSKTAQHLRNELGIRKSIFTKKRRIKKNEIRLDRKRNKARRRINRYTSQKGQIQSGRK